MILTAYINDKPYQFDIPQTMIDEGESFFSKIDADMDKGWQMSREFVEKPGRVERCQIAADRILDAMAKDNRTLALLLSAYIVVRMPGVTVVNVDTEGDILQTSFSNEALPHVIPALTEEEAMKQAEDDVSSVYKVGKVYRFSVKDPLTGSWEESPTVESEEEAKKMREAATKKLVHDLQGRRISLD